MRLIELKFPNHVPLIHDLIKNTTILLVIEILQAIVIGDPLLDKVFLIMLAFTLVGNLIYYLIVDSYIIGAGPVLSGTPSSDKQE